jgi:hypothetical protein
MVSFVRNIVGTHSIRKFKSIKFYDDLEICRFARQNNTWFL